MFKSRLHELSEHGVSVWIDSLSRQWLRDGTLDRADRGGRRRRRHVEPDDLPEGAVGRRLVRRAAEGGAARGGRRARDLLAARRQGRARPSIGCVRSGTAGRGWTATSRSRSTRARLRPRDDVRAGDAPARVGRPPNLYVKIPATEPGLGAIEESIARGRNINVTLIFGLDRYEAVATRTSAASNGWSSRRRSFARRIRRVLLRLARRYGDRQAARGDRNWRTRCAARQARDREREARLRAVQANLLRRSLETCSRRRARRSSAACGRRRRRRTPSTAT